MGTGGLVSPWVGGAGNTNPTGPCEALGASSRLLCSRQVGWPSPRLLSEAGSSLGRKHEGEQRPWQRVEVAGVVVGG